ncbi:MULTISPECIES: SusC/RagA family TonB-linked outer membrane protein [Hymenobacter]|uniref:TonB-dependent receptor n=1 Tax=Hymenobacter jejuensis TaxID=2502781 RepID=A0A5B8A1A5_9BACT|nr:MULTISPECIES: TonB-dependent receptor [Hymenobacter]MBC6990480.1 TonB-dependent receptor [Hymenobacter sp. BT491]QDA61100.1 TonB-dependent receptor [Hymenobacter jejuensis]
MKQKFLLTLVWFLLLATAAWAQTRTVSGHVTGADGSGLPGVTVLEKGTTNGASTNASGEFSLTVQPNATLVVSSIGYTTQNVVVGNRSTVDITLKTNDVLLSEAVVVGYGTQSKADLTGAITQVSGREVQNAPVPSFEQAIQGKAAGVFIENSSGKLGQGIKVRVRGTSSVSGGTQPLYVVDGIPIISENQSGTSAATNPIADLNPNDIESISILKDASASAIYGSRASNGVVLITTKRGKAGGTNFTLGYQTGLSEPTHLKDFLNAQEYVELIREAGANRSASYLANTVEARLRRYSAGNDDYKTGAVNVDWQKEAFQRAPFSQYDLSTSGGNDKTRYFVSGLYSDQKGIIIGNKFEKISARVNLDHKATERLTMGLNFGLSRTRNNRISNDNAFSTPIQIVALSPITPLIDPRTGLASGALDLATGLPNINYPVYYNPILSYIGQSYVATTYRSLGNAFAQYEFVPGLTFRSELGIDLLNQDEDAYYGRITYRNSGPNNGDAFNRRVINGRYTTNNYLTYRKTFAENHSLEVVGGMAYEERKLKTSSVSGQQFPSDAYTKISGAAIINAGSTNETSSALLSYFGRVNYAFANKYLVSASFRADGSSRFGVNKRYGYFPAASVGWVITEEDFMKDQTILSFLKPRVSYGITGNQDFGDFVSRNLYGPAAYAGVPGQAPTQIGNPDLKWETTAQADAGLEFGFLGGRISGEVDIYQKKTKDLALFVNVPATSGFTRQFRNVGNLNNKGAEFVVNTRNLEGAFTWNTSINASTNRNKITNLQGQVIEGGFLNRAVEGQPIGVFFGKEYAGVDPANGDALFYLNTPNADGSLDRTKTNDYDAAQRVIIGNPNPKWTGGVTNTFGFKGIDFSFTFQGVFGNDIYDGGGKFQSANASNGYDNQTKDQLKRWRKPGDITNVPKPVFFDPNGTAGVGESSRYISDGSYVRLKTVTLGYNLPSSLVKAAHLQSTRIYVSGVNLLTFTDYKGWDPEVNADYLAGNISQGNDFYSAPQAKTYTIGVNIGF